MNNESFTPVENKTIAASTTSATTTFSATGIAATQLEINNETGATAFVRWGVGAQTAVVTDYPILSGQTKLVNKGLADSVGVILAAGATAGNVYVSAGEGM